MHLHTTYVRRKGLHPPSPTTPTISPFALWAMAAGIVSRYKTGLRLDTHRIPYTYYSCNEAILIILFTEFEGPWSVIRYELHAE